MAHLAVYNEKVWPRILERALQHWSHTSKVYLRNYSVLANRSHFTKAQFYSLLTPHNRLPESLLIQQCLRFQYAISVIRTSCLLSRFQQSAHHPNQQSQPVSSTRGLKLWYFILVVLDLDLRPPAFQFPSTQQWTEVKSQLHSLPSGILVLYVIHSVNCRFSSSYPSASYF